MKVEIKLDMPNIKGIERKIQLSLRQTGEAVKGDLKQSQTMPKDTGTLEDDQTFLDDSELAKNIVYIVSDTPYARRLYFHPEYNFRKDKNPHAGGEWFGPYLSGAKKDFPTEAFKRFME